MLPLFVIFFNKTGYRILIIFFMNYNKINLRPKIITKKSVIPDEKTLNLIAFFDRFLSAIFWVDFSHSAASSLLLFVKRQARFFRAILQFKISACVSFLFVI